MAKPFSVQVVIDCLAPHDLADWWADTLGWQVEPQDESFIRSMIDKGFATDADTTTHKGSLVWATATAIGPGESTTNGQPRVLFQKTDTPKSIKNRVHLDLRGTQDVDLDELHQSLASRGATQIGEGAEGPHRWIVYADPEGNEFCVDR